MRPDSLRRSHVAPASRSGEGGGVGEPLPLSLPRPGRSGLPRSPGAAARGPGRGPAHPAPPTTPRESARPLRSRRHRGGNSGRATPTSGPGSGPMPRTTRPPEVEGGLRGRRGRYVGPNRGSRDTKADESEPRTLGAPGVRGWPEVPPLRRRAPAAAKEPHRFGDLGRTNLFRRSLLKNRSSTFPSTQNGENRPSFSPLFLRSHRLVRSRTRPSSTSMRKMTSLKVGLCT